MHRPLLLFGASLVAALLLVGCATNGEPSADGPVHPADTTALQTRADTLAERLVEAHGGTAWASAPYLRFNFAVDRGSAEGRPIRHLWNRSTGDYRVEWGPSEDTTYVALINVGEVQNGVPAGAVYLDGSALEGARDTTMRRQAYRRFINDTYWLLAPLKVFDAGVNRTYLADSSDAEHDVLHLTFGDVGLTPDDEYWLYVDSETGRLDRWAFHLQGMADDAPPAVFDWTDYQTLSAPGGDVHLAARHASTSGPTAILTNELSLPSSVPDTAFSSPEPMLADGLP
jgi:hypothetical protein